MTDPSQTRVDPRVTQFSCGQQNLPIGQRMQIEVVGLPVTTVHASSVARLQDDG